MSDKPRLFYFYDALCGWCYGFSPVIQQLYETYQDKMDFQVVSGGMVTGERAGPIGKAAPYIKGAYKQVEETTGVTFGKAFLDKLEKGEMIFDSRLPAVAMTVFRSYLPDQTVPFANTLQRAVYYDGMPPADLEAYRPYLEPFDLPADRFLEQMGVDRFQQLAREDFAVTAEFGIRGFPTTVMSQGEKAYLLNKGYVSYEPLAEKIEELLQAG